MSPARRLICDARGATASDAVRSFVGRMEFGPSVLPELRKILLSSGEGKFYGPDGRLTEVKQVPFLEQWHLSRLDFDPDLGTSRLVGVLTRAGKTVTATIDASDFPDLRDNTSNNPEWNGCNAAPVTARVARPIRLIPSSLVVPSVPFVPSSRARASARVGHTRRTERDGGTIT
jgi:hypothetical protein